MQFFTKFNNYCTNTHTFCKFNIKQFYDSINSFSFINISRGLLKGNTVFRINPQELYNEMVTKKYIYELCFDDEN
jgi:hypothetical protein